MAKKKIQQAAKAKSIYDLQAEICAALASPIRLQILELVSEHERTSSELLEELQIPKANLSQHLAVLKDAGILHSRKDGLFQYVSLAVPKIKDACSLVRSVLLEKIALEDKHNSQLIRELRAQR
jgi:ArsR family transcriptional regulator, virulence genes transcriptional regulator